jgi:DNA-binding PadR family transcriptional regulator
MPIPTMTPLQYLILAALRNGERSGARLRATLNRDNHATSLPAFYQLMRRIETLGWIEGRYEVKIIDGNASRTSHGGARRWRFYRATPAGRAAWAETRRFYGRFAADS